MEVSCKILRKSIHTFLQNYQNFTTKASLLALPFSASILLSQALVPLSSSLFPQIYNHLKTLFYAAGFPSSHLFTILNLKVSQTITSSIFTFPFTLTFFLIAKAFIIQALNKSEKYSQSSSYDNYKPILHTYFYNTFFILSANATTFCLLFLAFSFSEGLGNSSRSLTLFLSAAAVVFFSVILANVLVMCNMALTVSGMEGRGGYMAILKACILLRGKTTMALFLALPVNVGLAAIEALFQFRVVRGYYTGENSWFFLVLEGIFIAYMYSIFIIIDTIVSCMFYKSCKIRESWIDKEDKHFLRIEFIGEENYYGCLGVKNFQELP
ncbi:uncharacterized protein LOC131662596 [Vicia villosa]|uniref:uncharacterized protein LOC131662596 n=1 Tax=Vicia villosa TaxID=3911 RepID=UPI00273AF07B|nr:uncharacterized protein LOC131662596 [Vicia villosa]